MHILVTLLQEMFCFFFLDPARPETTCLTAHRLITGALGMRSQMAREHVNEEKQKLQEAKGFQTFSFVTGFKSLYHAFVSCNNSIKFQFNFYV